LSDEVFIIPRGTALAYREQQLARTDKEPRATPLVDQHPGSTGALTGVSGQPGTTPQLPLTGATIVPSVTWSGEVPAQKWMNFYTRVLSKFATGNGLRLTVKVEVAPDGGMPHQKLEETRAALRELGLNDKLDQ
ncbi:MAG: AAA family ATPase, partial [Betaproteobacteria bacterium]|nr:AAA family ATPase [Betaproteobacteria bacterium]